MDEILNLNRPPRPDGRFTKARALKIIGERDQQYDYLNFIRLREELELFRADLDSLARGHRILYAVDGVAIRASVDMNLRSCKGFSFPISEDHDSTEALQYRGLEYADRLGRLFNPAAPPTGDRGAPRVCVIPPTAKDIRRFYNHIVNEISASNKFNKNLGEDILEHQDHILREIAEASKNHLNQSLEDLQRLVDKMAPLGSGESFLQEDYASRQAGRDGTKDAVNRTLDAHVRAVMASNLSSEKRLGMVDRLQRFAREERHNAFYTVDGVLRESDFDKDDEHGSHDSENIRAAIDEINAVLAGNLGDHAADFNRLKNILVGLYLNNSDEENATRDEPKIQSEKAKQKKLDRDNEYENSLMSAEGYTYIWLINKILKSYNIAATMQLVTHQNELTYIVRSLDWERHGFCVRHPKFLAGVLSHEERKGVGANSDSVVNALAHSLKKIELSYESQIGQANGRDLDAEKRELFSQKFRSDTTRILGEVREQIKRPWSALKANIYTKELASEPIERGDCVPIPTAQGDPTAALATRLYGALGEFVATAQRAMEIHAGDITRYLLRGIPEQEKEAYFAHMPSKGLEPPHIMLVPHTGALRYIIKLPESIINLSGIPDGNLGDIHRIDFADFVRLINVRSVVGRELAEAICAGVGGEWGLVRRILARIKHEDIFSTDNGCTNPEQRMLKREINYLSSLGYRGYAATVRAFDRASSRELINRAEENLEAAKSVDEFGEDLRLSLSSLGWSLEALYFAAKDPVAEGAAEKGREDTPTVLLRKCEAMLVTVGEKQDAGNWGQEFYWGYIETRLLQFSMMLYAAVEAQLLSGGTETLYEFKFNKKAMYWTGVADKCEKGLAKIRKIRGHRTPEDTADFDALLNAPVAPAARAEEEKSRIQWEVEGARGNIDYPAAQFLISWVRLLHRGDDVVSAKSSAHMDILAKSMQDIIFRIRTMEVSYMKLSPGGFPAHVFSILKSIQYSSCKDLLESQVLRTFDRLIKDASREI